MMARGAKHRPVRNVGCGDYRQICAAPPPSQRSIQGDLPELEILLKVFRRMVRPQMIEFGRRRGPQPHQTHDEIGHSHEALTKCIVNEPTLSPDEAKADRRLCRYAKNEPNSAYDYKTKSAAKSLISAGKIVGVRHSPLAQASTRSAHS